MFLAVVADVVELEALGEVRIVLERGELPAALQRVLHVELDLRSVERTFAGEALELQPCAGEAVRERAFAHVPVGIGADALLGTQRELDVDVLEAEGLVGLVEHLEEALDLLGHLLAGAEDVRVVLAERAHAREAVHHAAALVAVEASEVRHAPRQLAVAAPP